MSSNIKISGNSLDRRAQVHGSVTDFDDDPAGAANPSEISVAEINVALATGNVAISTQSASEAEEGDITFASPFSYTNTAARTLTLNAADDIFLNADITPGAGAGALNLAFNANSSAFNQNSGAFDIPSGDGHVEMGAGVTINSNGGSIGFGGAARNMLRGTITSGGGSISSNAMTLAGALAVSSGNGNISIFGPIDGAQNLVLDAGTGVVSTASGAIGAVDRLTGFGARGADLLLSSATHNVATLAVALSGANEGVSWTNAADLTIGTVGSVSGITTNTGNVTVTANSGGLTVSSAINTAGAAAPGGGQTGQVTLTGANGLDVQATINSRAGVSLNGNAGLTKIGAAVTGLGGIGAGGSTIDLGANLQSDGGFVALTAPTRITASSVTIDTDQTAGGNAGAVTFNTLNGLTAGANTLIVDARETPSGSGTGGSVSFQSIGAATRLGALGVAGRSATFNSTANNVGTLAIALTDANAAVSFTNTDALTIGTVGPVSGITTNTGNVTITTTGGSLTVNSAINTAGAAAPGGGQTGQVILMAANGLDVQAAINSRAGVSLNGSVGLTTIGAAVTGLGGIGAGGSAIDLGANLQSDGGSVFLTAPTRITAISVTIDTDQTAGGNAGAVTFNNTLNGLTAGANTLIVDARETLLGSGSDGIVSFQQAIGATTRLGALGVAGQSVGFNSNNNNVGALAVALSGTNAGFSLTNTNALTIGTVGPISGITTNTGNVTITTTSGNLTVNSAIDTVGAAAPNGGLIGSVYLSANGGALTVSAPIVANGVSLGGANGVQIGANIDAGTGGFGASGSAITLAGNIQTNGGVAGFVGGPVALAATTVTIDTDQTPAGNAGSVTFNSGVNGNGVISAPTLIVDARETGLGSGIGGNVQFQSQVGNVQALSGLGIRAASASFSTSTFNPNNVGTLAVNLTGANQGILFFEADSLTIGEVGPASGITTNTGNVVITAGGTLTVSRAISAVGAASSFGPQSGAVSLTSNGAMAVLAAITGNGVSLNTNNTGAITVGGDIDAGVGDISIGGTALSLGANLKTDGRQVLIQTATTTLTSPSATIDTDQTITGTAGNVTLNTVNGTTAGASTLVIDASETGGGIGGNINLNGTIGATTALAALGLSGNAVFSNPNAQNNVGTLAAKVTGANQSIIFVDTDALAIGTVGGIAGLGATGSINVSAGGALTVSNAVTAATGVQLSSGGGQALSVNAAINAGAGQLILTGNPIALGADLQTDGGHINVATSANLTAPIVRIDTDQLASGTAGNVFVSIINSMVAGNSTLIIDAHETGGGTGGQITLGGAIGGTRALAALGLSGDTLVNNFSTQNDVRTLAVDLTGANAGLGFVNMGALTIGSVGGIDGIDVTGGVTVSSGGALTVDNAVVAGQAISLSTTNLGPIAIDAKLTSQATVSVFGGLASLGADIYADGTIALSSGSVTANLVTVDSDQTVGGGAGNITVSSLDGQPAGTTAIVLDAREAGGGTGGDVTLYEAGGTTRLGGLGVAGNSLTKNGVNFSVGTLAVNLTGAGGFSWTNIGALTVGTVGGVSGVSTNGGAIALTTTSGDLTVSQAISGLGVTLSTAGNLTINNVAVNSGAAALSLSGSAVTLGGSLQSDGAAIIITGPVTLLPSLTVDTDTTSGGTAGNVTFTGAVNGSIPGVHSLIIDARETNGLTGGAVTFGSSIGDTVALSGLGVAARTVSFGGTVAAGTIAFDLSGPNAGVNLAGNLAVGSVGTLSGIHTNTGNVTLAVTGGLTVSQSIATAGTVAASGGSTGAVLLNATNGVTLSGASGDVTTPSTYTVNADSNSDGTGTYAQDAGSAVMASGAVKITAADVVLNGTINSAAADVTFVPSTNGATIGLESAGKSFSLTDAELDKVSTTGTVIIGSAANTGGITIGTDAALTQGGKNFQFVTDGAIAIGANSFTTTGNVALAAASASTGTGVIAANSVNAATRTGMAFNTSAATLTLNNTTSGNIAVNNTGATSVAGANAGGEFVVTATGVLTAGGTIGGSDVRLTGASVALGNAVSTAGTLELKATAGTIAQTAALSAGTLTGSATGAATLANGSNAIATLGAFNATGITLVDGSGGLTVSGAVDAGTGAAAMTTTGNLLVNGSVKGTAVTLTANTGEIHLGADVDARSGIASFQNLIQLTDDVNVTGNGGITFNGAILGIHALTASSTGTATFRTINISSALTITASSIVLNNSVIATTHSYNGAVTLGGNIGIVGQTANFPSTVNGNGFNFALMLTGATTIDGSKFIGIRDFSTGSGGGTTLGGTLTTSGTQTHDDAVTLSAGVTLASTAAGALGNIKFGNTVDGTTAGAETLAVNTAGTTSFVGAVGGSVALASVSTDSAGATQVDGGLIRTSGAQTYNDDVMLGANTSFVSTNSGTITFADTVHTDFALSVNTAGSAVFSGAISGTGSFTQAGSGTTTLAATNAYAGATSVNAGTLLVNGSIAASSGVTVASGATLGGTGFMGAVTVNSGGTLAAGQSAGILHTGNLMLSAGAILKIEISGTTLGSFDQVDVTGDVSLNGALLSASLLTPFQLSSGNTLIIINNDGADGVIGTFSGLADEAIYVSGGSSYRIDYNGGTGNDVTLTALNDAPVLTGPSPALDIISEDDAANTGQLVSEFRGTTTDTDPATSFGIAITAASTTNGRWQYLDSTSTWTDFGFVDGAHALLLRDQDRIRFVPDTQNGTTATLSYRAWDQSVGSAGQKFDTSVNGSITAFSAAENTASLTVESLNDAPTFGANAGLTVAEGDAGALGMTALRFIDVDAGAVVTYTLTTPTAHGTLFRDTVSLDLDDTFTQQDIDAGLIGYQHDNGETTSDSFGFSVGDGFAPAITGTFAITVTPVNDAPVRAGDLATEVREGDSVALGVGDITATDSDNTNAQLVYTVLAAAHGSVLRNGVVATSFTQTDLAAGLIAFRHDGGEADGAITLSLTDGSAPAQTATVTVAVNPHVEDAPVLGGDGAVTVAEGAAVTITTSDLTATDPDNTNTQLIYTVTALLHGFIQVAGVSATSFTQADLAGGLVKFVHDGDEVDGGFEVALTDNTALPQVMSVTAVVDPHVNDAPVPVGGTGAAVIAPENVKFVTTVQAQDSDTASLTYAIVGGDDQGLFEIDALTGTLSFRTAPNFEDPADTGHDNHYIVAVRISDGALSSTQTIGIDVSNVDEVPVITSDGAGATASLSLLEGKTSVTTVHATDAENAAITYSIAGGADAGKFRIDALTGALSFITAPRFFSPGDADHDNSYVVQVSASDGSLSTIQTITANISPGIGTAGNDMYSAPIGASRIDAGAGNDSIAFAFKLTDAAISFSGNEVTIDGPSSHTVLAGFESYVFADGVVSQNDGRRLVDDLFYYSQNHDVWNAHLDADAHYDTVGWREGRDPSALFSTNLYLWTNPDVKAAGVDPLNHWHDSGWREGRAPSLSFDPAKYLAANPDVAAAGLDPLFHYLQSGYDEGRQPLAPDRLVASNGFDYVYYLAHNPDVAAAHLDPFQHFETAGWKEGRNPNANFDTAGYLAAYQDVAAAGINPLDHYHVSGWLENRDPSTGFDTRTYLASNPDVAAAKVDPLVHFLTSGAAEGRSAFADGIWG